jgi:hypothetical protein
MIDPASCIAEALWQDIKRIGRVVLLAGLLVTLAFLLSGCAQSDMLRAAIAEKGAQAADDTLESALWVVCDGSSTGAIRRRFVTEADKAAYNQLCPIGDDY